MKGISRQKVVDQINSGTLPARRQGRSWRIDIDKAKHCSPRSNNITGANDMGSRDDSSDGNEQSPLNKARTQREMALAEIKIMEAEQMRGELVYLQDVERQAFTEGRRVRDAILNMPARISAELACETDPHKVEKILVHECRELLTGLAIEVDEKEKASNGNRKAKRKSKRRKKKTK